MNKLEFIRALDAGSIEVGDKTADLWFHILSWVRAKGYADTADTPEFVSHVQAFRQIGVPTVARHLSRMAEAGFLQAHTLRRRLSPEAKDVLNTSLHGMVFGGGSSSLPSSFVRYTLPGAACPREFKTADALAQRNRECDDELRGYFEVRGSIFDTVER